MQHDVRTAEAASERAEGSTSTASPQWKKPFRQENNFHNFIRLDRETQLQAFYSWLPKDLADAPGIDWAQYPTELMGYCVRSVGKSPEAAILALLAVSIHGAMTIKSQKNTLIAVNWVLRQLRSKGLMQHLSDLTHEQVWYDWIACLEKTSGIRRQLTSYAAAATLHVPHYLSRLDAPDRLRLQAYAPPPFPHDLAERYFPYKSMLAVQEAKRKAHSDILVPLYPVLRQLIRFRKQVTERMVLAIREAQRLVEAGEAVLPFHFEHTDTIPEVNRDARTIAEVQIQGRTVTMHFILWDKPQWVLHHREHYSDHAIYDAETRSRYYAREHDLFFVQFDGPSRDLLWFGEFVEHRLFQGFNKMDVYPDGYLERWQLARQLGFSYGCDSDRPGLLNPGDRWFCDAAERGKELIFDYESLYRGVLFGATLAMLALSNGSRVSELLQVSWNKERRVTRQESVLVLGEDGQPLLGADGKPITKQVKLHFQYLLPKGAKTEEERQVFPLSKESVRLLGEIKTLLEQTYGEIPVVSPSWSNTKREHLKPERYLFQWAAFSRADTGAISAEDVQMLIRFMLHGLDLYTAQGKPIRVSVHILRHVMATHARHYRKVPPEAIAYFFLHHRLKELTGRTPSLADSSEYYTLMTAEQRFAIIHTDLDEQEEMDHALLQAAPTPRDLEQMDEDLRAVFELWHALHPTAFGNCGCPGLCPRGTDRALCLGCSYLVTDPERMGAALSWRASYAKQAELLEAQGNAIDARQARIKVQQLDDVINVMRLQLQAEAGGSYIPLHKILPSPYRKREEGHEETN